MMDCKIHRTVSWTAQILAAAILGQTLFFKFTGAAESRFIFTTLGVEPWGRWLTGILELIAVGLLLTPRAAVLGGVLGAGLMGGAVMSHLTKLGLVVQDDGGLLFGLAVVTLVASALVVWLRRTELPVVGSRLASPGRCELPPGGPQ